MKVLLCVFALTFLGDVSCWFFSGWSSQKDAGEETKTVKAPQGRVPFEMTTADDKFLTEAKSFTQELSALDLCHHMVSLPALPACEARQICKIVCLTDAQRISCLQLESSQCDVFDLQQLVVLG